MIKKSEEPIYGPSHAVLAVLWRAYSLPLFIQSVAVAKSELLTNHVRGMHEEAFKILWESHVAQMGGSNYSYSTKEAREIFAVAVEAQYYKWAQEELKQQNPDPGN